MALGKRPSVRQEALFVATSEISVTEHPFYRALDKLLREDGFDEFAEEVCAEFYAGNVGRPGVPPGVYFRALMVGYLEGILSERGIAWRCRDSFFGAGVPGVRADEEPAGPFELVEDAQAAERGGARGGVRARAAAGGRLGAAGGRDAGRELDDSAAAAGL